MDHEGSGNMNKLRSVDRYIVDIYSRYITKSWDDVWVHRYIDT